MEEQSVMSRSELSSETITKLAKAMLKVQAVIGPAFKDKANDFTKSRYATLNSVMDSCMEILTENGIWLSQYPVGVQGDGKLLGLVTKLVHVESGEWQSSLLVMPLPKSDPQGYGSAMTYARRYGLSAMVGIVTEDDDANSACQAGTKGVVHNSFKNVVPPAQTPAIPVQKQPLSTSATNSQRELNTTPNVSLPRIDGVNYQQLTAGNGAPYVVATGQTRGKSPMLKEAGFSWDASGKRWWRYAS